MAKTNDKKNTQKKPYVQFVTPPGKALWPHITKSDAGQSEYAPAFRVTLEVDGDTMDSYKLNNGETLMTTLLELYDEAKEEAEAGNKQLNLPPWKETDEGNYQLSFKLPAEYTDKATRTIKDNVVTIVDGKLKAFDSGDQEIGMGSKIRVNFWPYTYNAGGKTGVSLRLKAVQVLEFVPKGGNTFGFAVEESDEEEDTSFDISEF